MKWSRAWFEMRNLNRVIGLAMITVLAVCMILMTPALHAKAAPAHAHSTPVSLDDIELDEPVTSPPLAVIPEAIKSVLAIAEKQEKAGNDAAVISTLKPKMDLLPRSGLLQLGRAFARLKDPTNEIHVIELVTAKNPKDYVAQVELGRAYLEVKRYDDAATAFSTARELNSKYRPAYEGAWLLLEANQETAEARSLVQDIVKTFGADAKTTAALCRLYSGEGFIPEKSEEVCRTAIRFDPKNPANYVFETMNLRDNDQKQEADKAVVDAARRFPASESVQVLAGELKANDKSFGEAYRYYLQAVKVSPNSSKALLGLAKSAFNLQKHGESIDAFSKACKLDRKATLDFRQAATALKKNKDEIWLKYQDAINDRCD